MPRAPGCVNNVILSYTVTQTQPTSKSFYKYMVPIKMLGITNFGLLKRFTVIIFAYLCRRFIGRLNKGQGAKGLPHWNKDSIPPPLPSPTPHTLIPYTIFSRWGFKRTFRVSQTGFSRTIRVSLKDFWVLQGSSRVPRHFKGFLQTFRVSSEPLVFAVLCCHKCHLFTRRFPSLRGHKSQGYLSCWLKNVLL